VSRWLLIALASSALALSVATAQDDGLGAPPQPRALAPDWAQLAAQVEAGDPTLAPDEEGRLLNRALEAFAAGNGEADLFVSAVVARRLDPYRRADGTVDWAQAQAVELPTHDGAVHPGLPLFLKESARAIRTGEPGRLDELADAFSGTDVLQQLGVLTTGMSVATGGMVVVDHGLGRIYSSRYLLRTTLRFAAGLSLIAVARGLSGEAAGADDVMIPIMTTTLSSGAIKGMLRTPWLERSRTSLLKRFRLPKTINLAYAAGEVVLTYVLASAWSSAVEARKQRCRRPRRPWSTPLGATAWAS
jgi:hypothetical protein